MTLPSFIILGVQRGGTTSLYDYLTQHPRIAHAKRKEVHYFDLNYAEGTSWYEKQFPWSVRLRSKMITGEASPYYIFHPYVRDRVAKVVPDAKFIVLLRDPVDRAYSHYQHCVRRGWETLSFADAIREEPVRLAGEVEKLAADDYTSYNHQHFSYVTRGVYVDQITHWYERFDPSQFLILRSEDLFTDPATVTNSVFEFLGLDPLGLETYAHRNLGGYEESVASEVRSALSQHYAPHNARLVELLGPRFTWD